ncbi:MAG: helix-turn-helix transcriptional regulator [Nostoc sp. NMS1]|uniref:AraC family transcriptional regulator n=1 Tax=unclassified Nostoc TaxID=2593658 RepID=UPI0025F79E66|nr:MULTISPECIES: AraC family transcriptional regulator [unclassified Nostoc]MBN3905527.1 helix-turn-helix transcriptional regulator [Nostoc sp. NMS1]MBN3994070.1 helix-turn-helix transcriptional regulator [Nostoc sp. NMS2]
MVSSNEVLEQRNSQAILPDIHNYDMSDRQQICLALQRTDTALKSKMQELLSELSVSATNEQLCAEKASYQQTQTELQKSLSLLQATLDFTEELLEAIAPRLEKHVALKQRDLTQSQRVAQPQPFFPTCFQLKEVFDYIEANYHQSIGLSDVAVAVGYSAAYLTNLVRRKTGKTVNDWIFERRMLAARTLLLETNQPVNQIACAIGYQYEGYFFRQFRQFHDTTPQAWRNTQRPDISVNQ